VLEGAVEDELRCGAEAARDTDKGGELCARLLHSDKANLKGDGWILVRLAACVPGDVEGTGGCWGSSAITGVA